MRWIGRSILEFLVDEDYSSSFIDRLNEFNGYVRFIPGFDIFQTPRINQKESEIEEANERAIRGLVLQRDKSKDQIVHDFFDKIIQDLGPKAIATAKKYAQPSRITEHSNLISKLDNDSIPVINEISRSIIHANVTSLPPAEQEDWLHEHLKTMTLMEDFNNSIANQNGRSMEDIIRQADIDFRMTKIAASVAIKSQELTSSNFAEIVTRFNYGFSFKEDYIQPFIEEWRKLSDNPDEQAKILLKLTNLDEIIDILDQSPEAASKHEMDMCDE
jgi:hypothetical protein